MCENVSYITDNDTSFSTNLELVKVKYYSQFTYTNILSKKLSELNETNNLTRSSLRYSNSPRLRDEVVESSLLN